jgi:hypothetical protein
MAASKTPNVAFRRGRYRSNKTAGVFESSGRFIAVEPNQHSSSAPLLERNPVEKSEDVLFAVSLDADGIWRIKQFDSAFVKLFGVPQGTECDVTQ